MSDEERLRQIYKSVVASWKMFRKHTGTDCTDAKWDSIFSEAGKIEIELVRKDKSAKAILDGFVRALEIEDKMKRGG